MNDTARATDAERRLLGALLLDTEAFWRVADIVDGNDFTRQDHGDLWAVISRLAKDRKQADGIVIADIAPDLLPLATELLSETPSAANARIHAEIVARDATDRRVKRAGIEIAGLDGPDTIGHAQKILADCMPKRLGLIRHASDFLRESVARMQQRADAESELSGVPTPFPSLDRMTGGFQPADLIVFAARPSIGKTAIALQCALHAAQHGHGALFVSLEMSGSQLTDRALAMLARVDSSLIRSPKRMPPEDWGRVLNAGSALAQAPLRIDDTSVQTVETMCARIRQAHFAEPLAVVFVDYLGLVRMPKAERHDIAIGLVTKELKALAKDLHIPIIVLAQLNRGEGRPTLARLRDSGDIEQDADIVVFLHRPDESARGHLECIVAKHRNGPTGDFRIIADLSSQTMAEQAWEAEVPVPVARGFRPRTYNDD